MTRTIILVRHGKACSLDAFEKDIDRVLTQRGVNDGYKVAGKILESGYKIDLILSSPAARASHSALIFARSMNLNAEKVRIIDSLYHGSDSKILDILNDLPEEVETVAVFSHNPPGRTPYPRSNKLPANNRRGNN